MGDTGKANIEGKEGNAAAMAQQSDGAFEAAAPVANEAGWVIVFKEPHEEDIMQEDGSTKKVLIIEGTQLKSSMDNFTGGVWFGGKKFTFNRFAEDEESAGMQIVVKTLTEKPITF